MDLGLVLQTTPPAARVVDLAKRAEQYGFSHVWTFDSHILWEEPYVIYSQILAETRNVIVGPMVTNPATRDWTVTASTYATLNEMYGNRTICGIGRGDSAVRVTNGKPTTLATMAESIHVIRELANGRSVEYKGSTITLPWASKSRLEVWGAGYGPKALEADRRDVRRLHPPARRHPDRRVDASAPYVTRRPRPAVTRPRSRSAWPRRPTSATISRYLRDQCRWFGGMVGNHVADIVERYGESAAVPAALTDYIKGRTGYDYNEHGQAGNTHTSFVPDEIVDRFCILGPVDEHVRRLNELASSVSISSPSTCNTTARTARSRRTATMSSRRSPQSVGREDVQERAVVCSLAALLMRQRRCWELYKTFGPETAASCSDGRSCQGPTTPRCRTCGTCCQRFTEPERRGSDRDIWQVVLAGAWYSFRLAVVRVRPRRRRRPGAWPS